MIKKFKIYPIIFLVAITVEILLLSATCISAPDSSYLDLIDDFRNSSEEKGPPSTAKLTYLLKLFDERLNEVRQGLEVAESSYDTTSLDEMKHLRAKAQESYELKKHPQAETYLKSAWEALDELYESIERDTIEVIKLKGLVTTVLSELNSSIPKTLAYIAPLQSIEAGGFMDEALEQRAEAERQIAAGDYDVAKTLLYRAKHLTKWAQIIAQKQLLPPEDEIMQDIADLGKKLNNARKVTAESNNPAAKKFLTEAFKKYELSKKALEKDQYQAAYMNAQEAKALSLKARILAEERTGPDYLK